MSSRVGAGSEAGGRAGVVGTGSLSSGVGWECAQSRECDSPKWGHFRLSHSLARAESEAARAAGAQEETTEVRAALEQTRIEHDTLRESLGELRGTLAVVTSERDVARA